MIVFDAVTTGGHNAGGPLTVSHTVAAGSDLCLFALYVGDGTTDADPAVEWNGTPMDMIGEVVGSATSQHVAAFELVNPDTGTHDAISTSVGIAVEGMVVISYSGVDQTTPTDGLQTDSGSGTDLSSVVTSATGDIVIDIAGINGNAAITIGGGHTERANFNQNAAAGTMVGAGEGAGAGSVTMSWTWSGAQRSAQVAFNVNSAEVFVDTGLAWIKA